MRLDFNHNYISLSFVISYKNTNMPITVDQLKEKLQSEIGATHMDIVDTSDGCGAKFQALIVSPKFEGKPLLQRHRMVNTAIEAEMKEIHAFQMKTLTPEQWEKQNS